MTARAGAALALIAQIALAAPARGDDPDPDPVAFLELRPTDARRQTALGRLAEAQELRAIAEDSLARAGGRTVLGHDELKRLLGASYLRNLFACGTRLDCVRRQLRPVQARTAIVAEYVVERDGTYRIRLTAFAIRGKDAPRRAMLALPAADVRDAAKWTAAWETLFPPAPATAAPTTEPEPSVAPPSLTPPAPEPEPPPPSDPVRAPPPPTQASAAGGGAGKAEEAGVGFSMFGKIAWEAIVDPQNQGDYLQEESPPPEVHPRDWHVGLPNVDYFGVVFVAPKRGAWQARGTAVLGLLYYRKLRLDVAWGQIRNDELGFSITAGRIYNPTVNNLDPGTYGDYTELGSLLYVWNGVRVSQSIGKWSVDLNVGRPEPVTLGETPPVEHSAGSVYLESRVAYTEPSLTGTLYGDSTPLVLSASGAVGKQRVGPGETPPGAASPGTIIESLPVWIVSAEARVPIGPLMLLTEVYAGRGAAFYGGAMFRFQRIDDTGHHHLLLSNGMWGQVSYRPSGATELIAVAGIDRNIGGFTGVDAYGSIDIKSNLWLAGILNIDLARELRIGLQAQWIRSGYPGYGTFSHPGAIADFAFHF